MKEALDGLPGVHSVDVDLAHDRFDVEYDADLVTPPELLAAVTRLGYAPELVATTAGERKAPGGIARVDVPSLPATMQEVLRRSLGEDKPVLVRFTGPG